jgi:hypothetical protein
MEESTMLGEVADAELMVYTFYASHALSSIFLPSDGQSGYPRLEIEILKY